MLMPATPLVVSHTSRCAPSTVREAARQRCESEDHTAVLLSERPGSQKGRVTDMLEQQGLAFDQIILRPEGKKQGSPSQFKAKWVRNLLKRLKMSKGKEAMAEVRA